MLGKLLEKGYDMAFDILCTILLMVFGFMFVLAGGIFGIQVINNFLVSPLISFFLLFGIIVFPITIGILMISGAYRKSREILDRKNTKEE